MTLLLVKLYLCLANSSLYVVVGHAISDGIPNPNTMPLNQEVIIDEQLYVAIELPGDLVTPFHGDDVHDRARLVSQCVFGEDSGEKHSILNQDLHVVHTVCTVTHIILTYNIIHGQSLSTLMYVYTYLALAD